MTRIAAAIALRLAAIANDPDWPAIYRAEAGAGVDGWDGRSPLNPRSLSDHDVREALHARILARGTQPSTARPDDPERMRARLAELDAAR